MPNKTMTLAGAVRHFETIRDSALAMLDSIPKRVTAGVPVAERETVRLSLVAKCDQIAAGITTDTAAIIEALKAKSIH